MAHFGRPPSYVGCSYFVKSEKLSTLMIEAGADWRDVYQLSDVSGRV
jgi:hypothetical protein